MKHFFDVHDLGSLELALEHAKSVKANPRKGNTKVLDYCFLIPVFAPDLVRNERHKI